MNNIRVLKNETRGFTLIELLTVITIIGILASVVIPSLTGAREKARDAKRITEVSQIVLGIELYYNACGRQYPATLDLNAANGCTGTIKLASFLSNTSLKDPKGDDYGYEVNGTPPNAFVVETLLEKDNSALLSDINDPNVFGSGLDCSGLHFCKGNM